MLAKGRAAKWVWAAITVYHRLSGLLNNGPLFLTVLEDAKFKIKEPADLVSVESPLPSIITLCPHLEGGVRELSWVLSQMN